MCVCVAFSNDKRIPVVQFTWEDARRWYGDSPEGESWLRWKLGLQEMSEVLEGGAGGHRAMLQVCRLEGETWAAVAQSPQRDASTFRVAAGVEWGAMERARAQWRGHQGTLKLL